MLTYEYQLTGNDPSRMAESAAINKSLSVLGQVVHALNQGAVSVIISLSTDYLRTVSPEFHIATQNSPASYKMP
jgi:hypothetical protein